MISRSTLLGALVVVELAILGYAAQAVAGAGPSTHWTFPSWTIHTAGIGGVTTRLDKTFAAGPAPHVVVDVDQADVTIVTQSTPSVHVTGTMTIYGRTSGVKPSLDAVATTDGVRVAVEAGLFQHTGRVEREVRLAVPPGAQVEILSAGDVTTTGLHGKLIARLRGGDLRVSDQQGDVDAETSSGDIQLVDARSGSFALRTDDGDVKLTSSGADHVDAHTKSGSIAGADLRVGDGTLRAESGNIDVSFAADSDATVNLNTGSGSISGAGTTSSDDGSAAGRSVRLGSGRGHVGVSTDSGSITITSGANSHA